SVFFFSSRRRHTRLVSDWSSDVCSSDLRRQTKTRKCSAAKVAAKRSKSRAKRRKRAAHAKARSTTHLRGSKTKPRLASGSLTTRSEERRVGKGGRTRGGPDS